MAGPWEKYAQSPAGPWEKYQNPPQPQIVPDAEAIRQETAESNLLFPGKRERDPYTVGIPLDEATLRLSPEFGRIVGSGLVEGATAMPQLAESIVGLIPGVPQEPYTDALGNQVDPNDIGLMSEITDLKKLVKPETKSGRIMSNILASGVGGLTGSGGIAATTKAGKTAAALTPDELLAGKAPPVGQGTAQMPAVVPSKAAPKGAADLKLLLKSGLSGGAGGEIAREVTDDEGWKGALFEMGGSMAGSGVYGLLHGGYLLASQAAKMHGKRRELADILVGRMKDEDIKKAADFQRKAMQEQGVKLTAGQALPESNLPTFEDFVTRYPQGESLQGTFREQPKQVVRATEKVRGDIPGDVKMPDELAVQGQKAATVARQVLRERRSEITKPFYEGIVDPVFLKESMEEVKKRADQFPPSEEKYQILMGLHDDLRQQLAKVTPEGEEFAGQVTDDIIKRIQQGQPLDGIPETPEPGPVQLQELNEILRAKRRTAAGMDYSDEAQRELNRVSRSISQRLEEVNSTFKKGQEVYKGISDKTVNPVLEGVVGRMAGPQGYQFGVPSMQDELGKLFREGTTKGGKSSILKARRDLAVAGKQGQQAFNDAVKTYISKNISDSIELDGGAISPKTSTNLRDSFFKTEAQVQGFKDMLAGVALNSGADPKTVVDGMQVYIRTIQAAARYPQTMGPSGSAIGETTQTLLGKLNAITAFTPVRMPARLVNEALKRDALRYVTSLLDTPEGLETLKKLSKLKPGGNEAMFLIGSLHGAITQPSLEGE